MNNFVKLNKAAVENLLDGNLPPFAVVSRNGDGLRISPYKIRRGHAQPVIDGKFFIPEDINTPKRPFAARLEDNGDIVVYPAKGSMKPFIPSAKIMKGTIGQPVVETPPAPVHEEVVEQIEKLPTMLIKACELATPEPKPIARPTVQDTESAMEQRLREEWVAPTRKTRGADVVDFALSHAPRTLLGRRETGRTITVPISFDARRGLGSRAVEVLVKRRRFS